MLRLDARSAVALLLAVLLPCLVAACGAGAGFPELASNRAGTTISAKLQSDPYQPFVGSVEIQGLDRALLHDITQAPAAGGSPSQAINGGTVAVFSDWAVETRGDQATPLPGRFLVETDRLRFVPRFALRRGTSYRLRVQPAGADHDGVLWHRFELPGPPPTPTTRVESIYPGSSLLPENLQRITVEFSAPMARDESSRYLRLERDSGEVVEQPFLGGELWNDVGDRLTLLVHAAPGTQNSPAVAAPSLCEGDRLRLVISSGWPDVDGLPLAGDAEKEFIVLAPDRVAPDPAVWTLEVPEGATRSAVRLSFPEPLDRVLLERAIGVRDELGAPVPGSIGIGAEERSWSFVPDAPWSPGLYRLEIEPTLEDLAGNDLQELFDIEIGVATPESRRDLVRLLFDVGAGDAGAPATGLPRSDAVHGRTPRPSG